MVGYGRVALGSIFLIIAIIIFVGTSWTVYTYFDGIEIVEDEKKDRDLIESMGVDTAEINVTIEEHEDSLKDKKSASTFCSILGLIFLIFGVFFIMNWRKEKNRDTQGYYPTGLTHYPPPPPVWLQYPQQYQHPPQIHRPEPPEQYQPYPPKQKQ